MKKLLMYILILEFILVYSDSSFADGRTGVGIQIIDVTGFTVRKNISRKNAAAFTLGWRKSGDSLHVTGSGQYLYLWPGHLKIGDESMDTYAAPGLKFKSADPTVVEIRVAAGVSWMLLRRDLELYGEFIPGMDVYPETKLAVSLALGIRYYF